jgi:hypothetical protein
MGFSPPILLVSALSTAYLIDAEKSRKNLRILGFRESGWRSGLHRNCAVFSSASPHASRAARAWCASAAPHFFFLYYRANIRLAF